MPWSICKLKQCYKFLEKYVLFSLFPFPSSIHPSPPYFLFFLSPSFFPFIFPFHVHTLKKKTHPNLLEIYQGECYRKSRNAPLVSLKLSGFYLVLRHRTLGTKFKKLFLTNNTCNQEGLKV